MSAHKHHESWHVLHLSDVENASAAAFACRSWHWCFILHSIFILCAQSFHKAQVNSVLCRLQVYNSLSTTGWCRRDSACLTRPCLMLHILSAGGLKQNNTKKHFNKSKVDVYIVVPRTRPEWFHKLLADDWLCLKDLNMPTVMANVHQRASQRNRSWSDLDTWG